MKKGNYNVIIRLKLWKVKLLSLSSPYIAKILFNKAIF